MTQHLRLIFCYTLFVVSSLFLSSQVYGHGTEHPTRFIATDGVDKGDCLDSHNPCRSITYVVELAGKGDTVRIAAGEYSSSGTDMFYLLSGLVKIEAGYSRDDHYQVRNTQTNQTVFYGVPEAYRDRVHAMGFQAVRDGKAKDAKISKAEQEMIDSFAKLNNNNQAFTACEDGFAGEFECSRIDLVSRIPNSVLNSSSPSLNDVWGFVDLNDDREYAIVGLTNGTAVVDVTDAVNPVVVGHVSGFSSTWRDLKVYQYFDETANEYKAYAYVTTEASQGMQIIDLTDLPNSISLAATLNDFSTAHNVYISNIDYSSGLALPDMEAYIYVAGGFGGGANGSFRVYNLTDPLAPALASTAPTGTGYVHDLTTMVITDERTSQCSFEHNPCEILIDFNEDAVEIWDLTNKDAPFQISSTTYANLGYTHSGWYSDDKMFVFIQDEIDETTFGGNTVLRTMDISDLSAPFISNVYVGPTQAIDHNGFTLGNYYFMSNYRRGLTVLDISDANQPTEIGFFDTYPTPAANTASFAGAWGAYPYLPSGNVLISDSSYGLFVVALRPPSSAGIVGVSQPTIRVAEGDGSVTIDVARTVSSTGALSVDYATVDGSAVAGNDYQASSGTLTWADGDEASKTITITLIDDDLEEGNETFNVELSNFSDAEAAGDRITTITISANDAAPPVTTPPTRGGGGGVLEQLLLMFLLLSVFYRAYTSKNMVQRRH